MVVLRFIGYLLKCLVLAILIAIVFGALESRFLLAEWLSAGFKGAVKAVLWIVADLANREPRSAPLSFATNQFFSSVIISFFGLVVGHSAGVLRTRLMKRRSTCGEPR